MALLESASDFSIRNAEMSNAGRDMSIKTQNVKSAFSSDREQVIVMERANVLHAGGNITYISWDSQLLQMIGSALSTVFSSFRTRSYASEQKSSTTFSTIPNNNPDKQDGNLPASALHVGVAMFPNYLKEDLPSDARRVLKIAPLHCETYIESMIPLRNGYPLWYPQPNYNLPIEYRRRGILIGDVGIITPDGGFDFLFNVLLPYDHPVNMLASLPAGFNEPIRPKLLTRARTSYTESSTISNLKNIKTDFNESTSQISFICTDGDSGAILALPEGASEDDLSNEWHWKQFISRNALTWYRYARENCGRDLDRHSLYFVTGHTKSKSWGISTFNTPVPERNDILVIGKSVDANRPPFVWKKVEGASVYKSGPSLDSGLTSEADRMGNENQCLFLRGFKISLSEQAWKELWGDDGGTLFTTANSDNVFVPSGSLESQGTSSSIPPHSQYSKEVGISCFPKSEKQAFHPSNAINDHLLSLAPDSRIAVTHDSVWLEAAASVDLDNIHMLGVIVGSQFVACYHKDTAMSTLEPVKDIISLEGSGSSSRIDNERDKALKSVLVNRLRRELGADHQLNRSSQVNWEGIVREVFSVAEEDPVQAKNLENIFEKLCSGENDFFPADLINKVDNMLGQHDPTSIVTDPRGYHVMRTTIDVPETINNSASSNKKVTHTSAVPAGVVYPLPLTQGPSSPCPSSKTRSPSNIQPSHRVDPSTSINTSITNTRTSSNTFNTYKPSKDVFNFRGFR